MSKEPRHQPLSKEEYYEQFMDMDYDDDDGCWQCFGEGGWNSCFEDCCPSIGGEEGCTDPACWRVCDVCRGKGHLS